MIQYDTKDAVIVTCVVSMDNKRQQDIAWKDVPKDKKRRLVIKAMIIALCALFAGLLIAGVGGLLRGTAVNTVEQLTMGEEVDLNGIGLDDILSWKTPEGYENPEKTVGGGDELVGIEWNDEDSVLSISIQTYKGDCVMGFEEGGIDSYIEAEQYGLETVSIGDNSKVNAYISAEPVSYKTKDGEATDNWHPPADTMRMNALFEYGDYVLSLCLEKFQFGENGSSTDYTNSLTEEQVDAFYSILQSITFREERGN